MVPDPEVQIIMVPDPEVTDNYGARPRSSAQRPRSSAWYFSENGTLRKEVSPYAGHSPFLCFDDDAVEHAAVLGEV